MGEERQAGGPTVSDERPRVMHVYSRLEVGGVEWILLRLLPRLNMGRYQTSVCLLKRPGEMAQRLLDEGVRVHVVPTGGRLSPLTLGAVSSLFRRQRVAVVHAHGRAPMISATVAARLAGVRAVVGTIHTMNSVTGAHRALQERLLARWRDAIVTVSERVRDDYLRSTGTPPEKCVTIHHGVDTRLFTPPADDDRRRALRARFGLPLDAPVVLTVGRLTQAKAHDVLIAAVAEVVRTIPDARFAIVGGGPRETELRDLTARSGVAEHVLFFGPRTDLPDVYRTADLFCLSSAYEGFSIAIVEALASGLPVVATDVGGNREAVEEGITGFLTPAGDPWALARSLVALLRDPDLRRRMSTAARAAAARFSLDETVKATEALYDRILAAKG